MIRSIPSDKMTIFRGREETSRVLGDESAFMEEWRIAKCGSLEKSAIVAYCSDTYVYLNSNLVEGWNDKLVKSPDDFYRQDMPAMCQDVMDESQSISYKALDTPELLDLIRSRSEQVKLRAQCVTKAEASEVWSFFRSVKSSSEVTEHFLRPAMDIVRDEYGRYSRIHPSERSGQRCPRHALRWTSKDFL